MSNKVEEILAERGQVRGPYNLQCEVTQRLKDMAQAHIDINSHEVSAVQAETIDMILVKIGRIITGDPNLIDEWHDIAGYATLCARDIEANTPKKGKSK